MKKIILSILSIILTFAAIGQNLQGYYVTAYSKLEAKRAFVFDLDTFYATTQLNGLDTILVSLNYVTQQLATKENTLTKGNLTAGSTKVTIGGSGTNALIGTGASVDVNEANLSLQNIGGAVTDLQVPNTITLDNITQITNRSHTNLSDIGTNTHTQIDTHITNDGDMSITNELQTVDTFRIASNILELSLSSDGQPKKTVDLSVYAPASGSGNYIQNQNASAQSANMWISGEAKASTFQSTVATGTAPLTVASRTLVSNLNADLLDTYIGGLFAITDLNHTTSPREMKLWTSAFLPLNSPNYNFNAGITMSYEVTGYSTQLSGTSGDTDELFIRGKTNETWGNWYRIYHSGNLTNPITGTGTANYIPKWGVGGTSLTATSNIYDNGTNVGIGTTSPGYKLDVASGAANGLRITSSASSPWVVLKTTTANTTSGGVLWYKSDDTMGSAILSHNGVADNNLEFYTGGSQRVTIKSDGNVGIGTTAPTQKLDVNGNARFRLIGTGTMSNLLGVTSDGTLTTATGFTVGTGVLTSSNIHRYSTAYTFSNDRDIVDKAYVDAIASGFGTNYPDLTAIEALADTTGLLRKTAANTWSLDNSTYLTSYTETDPVWSAAATNYYTKTNLQTSGQSLVHWDNITNEPTFLTSYTETDPIFNLHTVKNIVNGTGFLKNNGSDVWSWDNSTYLTGNQTITISGDASGSGTTAITLTVADDSHNHNGTTISGLSVADFTSPNISNWTNDANYADKDLANTFLEDQLISKASGVSALKIKDSGLATFGTMDADVGYFFVRDGAPYFVNGDFGSTEINLTPTAFTYPGAGIVVSTGSAWGTSITDNSTNWNTAYNDKIDSLAFSGTTTKTLTLTQQDGGTVTGTFTDSNTYTSLASLGGLGTSGSDLYLSYINTSGGTPVTTGYFMFNPTGGVGATSAQFSALNVNILGSGTATSGYVPTANGTGGITWAAQSGYTLPLAANGTRGGIQIGYTETAANRAVQLSAEKAFVTLPDATTSAKGVASFSSTNFSVSSGAVSIATGGVTATSLANGVISGQVDIGTDIVDTDELLISDNGTLRRTDASRLKTYIGSTSGGWTDAGTTMYPTITTDQVIVGGTTVIGAASGAPLTVRGSVGIESAIYIGQLGSVSTPSAGYGIIWSDNDGTDKLYYTNDGGVQFDLTNVNEPFRSISTNTTLSATDKIVLVTAGGITITYPTVTAGKVYTIRNTASSSITVPSYTELGPSSSTTVAAYQCITVVYNGSTWYQMN